MNQRKPNQTENKMKKNWYKENLSRINLEAHRLLKVDNERRNGMVYRNQWRKAFCFAIQQVKQAVCREERFSANNAEANQRKEMISKMSSSEIEAMQMKLFSEGVSMYYQKEDEARQPKPQQFGIACAVKIAAVDADKELERKAKKRHEMEKNFFAWAEEENNKKVAYLHKKNQRGWR